MTTLENATSADAGPARMLPFAMKHRENDAPGALNFYGESKLLAERAVLAACPNALVVRPGKVFAPLEENDLRSQLRALARGERVCVGDDIFFSGAYLPDLVSAVLDLLLDGERGLWHLAHLEAVTPVQLLQLAATCARLAAAPIDGAPFWRLNHPAKRPRYRVLESERGQLLPPLEDALLRYSRETPPILEEPAERFGTR